MLNQRPLKVSRIRKYTIEKDPNILKKKNLTLHDPRNKTEKVFRGYDNEEIAEWIGVDLYKQQSKFKWQISRISLIWGEFKRLFKNYYLLRRQYFKSEDYLRYETYKRINKLLENPSAKENKEKINGIRIYIGKLSKWDNTYKSPLWKGLLEIEEDEVFLYYVKVLFLDLWD